MVTLIMATILALFSNTFTLVFIAISFYFSSFLLIDLLASKKPLVYGLLITAVIVSFFTFVFLYKTIAAPFGFVLFGLFSFSIGLVSFLNKYLLNPV
ncbi:MAG: hypothetical protein GX813_03350 [Erysipelotrichia bacterium]|nr:hypothetical protein [Erysipelotrichia bacterium]